MPSTTLVPFSERRVTVSQLRAKRRWRELDAREALDAHRADGGSLTAFARKSRLPLHRLRWWRKRLGRTPTSAGASAPRFLPVMLMGRPNSEPGYGGVEVVLTGGRRVRVDAQFDTPTLVRVVAALESLGC